MTKNVNDLYFDVPVPKPMCHQLADLADRDFCTIKEVVVMALLKYIKERIGEQKSEDCICPHCGNSATAEVSTEPCPDNYHDDEDDDYDPYHDDFTDAY